MKSRPSLSKPNLKYRKLASKDGHILSFQMVKRLASLELNSLLYANALPHESFNNCSIRFPGTAVYDINGELLFYRIAILKGRNIIACADIAANKIFGSPLIAISSGLNWNEKDIVDKAISTVRKQHKTVRYDEIRFVAYSFPKIAIQFLKDGQEVVMLEFETWVQVPKAPKNESDVNFQRWSLVELMPSQTKKSKLKNFNKHIYNWEKTVPSKKKFNPNYISLIKFKKIIPRSFAIIIDDSSELHYGLSAGDHITCYELRGQRTNVWCVAASVQMILDFYRYNYDQTRIAQELGLGTLSNPNGLPYSRDQDVVTVIERLTGNALDSNMTTTPNWTEFRDQIRANRPLISFIPGHSRTVVGYTRQRIGWYVFRGLLVYDPWPPTTGVITRWENFNTQTYRRTFTAHVTLV
jgi:hypothetical protein